MRDAFWLVGSQGIRAVSRDTHQTYSTLAAARAIRPTTKPHYKYDAASFALYRLRIAEGTSPADAATTLAKALASTPGDSWAWRRADALEWSKTPAGIDAIAAQRRARIVAHCERIATKIASVGWRDCRENFARPATLVSTRPRGTGTATNKPR